MTRCLRCKKLLKKRTASGLGADCDKVAWAEIEAFSLRCFRCSWTEFADSCMSDFATGYEGSAEGGGMTVEEYKAENGDYGAELWWAVETCTNHGLWRGGVR